MTKGGNRHRWTWAHVAVVAISTLVLATLGEIPRYFSKHPKLLIEASKYGLVTIVRLLLALGYDVNACDEEGNTALHVATRGNHHTVMLALLSVEGIDINSLNNARFTPLCLAVATFSNEALTLLLRYDANPNLGGLTPLQLAAFNGNLFAAKKLVKVIPIENFGYKPAPLRREIQADVDLFSNDYQYQELAIVRTTFAIGSHEEAKQLARLFNEPPTFIAMVRLHHKVVSFLLSKGKANTSYISPQFHCGYVRIATIICDDMMLNITLKGRVHFAAQRDIALFNALTICPQAVQPLIHAGANPRLTDSSGNTPLHHLAAYKDYKGDINNTVQALLRRGAVINARNNKGYTPLLLAAEVCNKPIIHILLENQADALITPARKWYTSFAYAMHCNDTAIHKLFADRGLDIDSRDSTGYTRLTKTRGSVVSIPYGAEEVPFRKFCTDIAQSLSSVGILGQSIILRCSKLGVLPNESDRRIVAFKLAGTLTFHDKNLVCIKKACFNKNGEEVKALTNCSLVKIAHEEYVPDAFKALLGVSPGELSVCVA
jgi:ankyrin repeat protein